MKNKFEVSGVKNMKVLETDENGMPTKLYLVYHLGWGITDRECLMKTKFIQLHIPI